MYKGQDLIGKAVVSYDHGRHEGQISQLLLDLEQHRLVGFVIADRESGTEKVVPIAAVQAIGADAAIVSQIPTSQPQSLEIETTAVRSSQFLQKPRQIFTDDGRALGTLGDVYVDIRTGEILGYAAQQGHFATLSGGQTFVPITGNVKISDDMVFVPAGTVQRMQEQEFPYQPLPPKAQQQAEPGAEKFLSAARQAKANPHIVDEVKGRRALQAVYTDQGEMLIAQGQIISDAIIEQARTHQQEQAVIDSTRSSSWRTPQLLDEEVWQNMRTRLETEAKQVSTGIGKMWQRVKDSPGVRKLRRQPQSTQGDRLTSSEASSDRQASDESSSSERTE